MVINGGPAVESIAQGLHRVREGPPETAGARSVYYHHMIDQGYTVFAMYVDHINAQSGILRLRGLFPQWSKPFDPGTITKATSLPRS
jgi:hypothetical protein